MLNNLTDDMLHLIIGVVLFLEVILICILQKKVKDLQTTVAIIVLGLDDNIHTFMEKAAKRAARTANEMMQQRGENNE